MRFRTIAAGVGLAALAGSAVPIALSATASAKGSGTPATVTITKCTPGIATVGHSVTIHGTDLTGATSVKIAGQDMVKAGSVASDTAKAIKIDPVPSGIPVTPNAATIKVTTPAGSATGTCSFKKVPKKKGHSK